MRGRGQRVSERASEDRVRGSLCVTMLDMNLEILVCSPYTLACIVTSTGLDNWLIRVLLAKVSLVFTDSFSHAHTHTHTHTHTRHLTDVPLHPEPVLPLSGGTPGHPLRPSHRHVEPGLHPGGDAYRRTALQRQGRGQRGVGPLASLRAGLLATVVLGYISQIIFGVPVSLSVHQHTTLAGTVA